MEKWGTNAVSSVLQQAMLRYMGVKLGVLVWRHILKAIFRKYIGSDQAETKAIEEADKGSNNKDEPIGKGDSISGIDMAAYRQTGYGARMGDAIYGRGI